MNFKIYNYTINIRRIYIGRCYSATATNNWPIFCGTSFNFISINTFGMLEVQELHKLKLSI